MSKRRDDLLKKFDENQLFMNTKVARGIEENRKGIARIKLTDADGNPIPNAHITLNQRTHDFNFGCSIFLLDEMETAEKNEIYKEKFKDIFNYAVAPFYWNALEPERANPRYAADSPKIYRRPAPDLVLDFCEENAIRVKGHCLVYHTFAPDWMPKDVPSQKTLTVAHLKEVADRYAGRINDWDVENENLCAFHFPKFRLYEEPDYLEWCFTQADRAFNSGNRLFINEAAFIWNEHKGFKDTRSPYYMQIERLISKGIRLDAIGMQFHQFIHREDELSNGSLPFDPEKLYEVMDCYDRFNRPLHISEITIPSYESSEDDEEVQAELVKNLYRVWFSHKAVDSIIWWNLADGYTFVNPQNPAWNENYYAGGLLRNDLSEKPAYRVLRELINEEWRTNLELTTDENGILEFNGFFGEYDIQVSQNEKNSKTSFHLSQQTREVETLVL